MLYSTIKKRWTINGLIDEDERKTRYYSDVQDKVNQLILPGVEDRNWTLLHGARSSGKSTMADVAKETLQKINYNVIYLDLQQVILDEGEDAFWESFGSQLYFSNDIVPSKLSSTDDFIGFFSKRVGILSKPTVVIVDEFSDLYAKSDVATKDSVLGILRAMKQRKSTHNLHSFLGVGTFNVMKLIGDSSSPFSVRESIECPPLSLDNVTNLFEEYSSNTGRNIDKDVIDDIWYRTSGHAGGVSFIGKSIAEHGNLRTIQHLTIDKWHKFINNHLVNSMDLWPPIQKLISTLELPFTDYETSFDKNLIADAIDILFDYFIYEQLNPIEVRDDMKTVCEFLTAEGVLNFCGDARYKIKSPLIQQLIKQRISKYFRQWGNVDIPEECFGENIDIIKITSIILKEFNVRNFLDIKSTKLSRALGVRGSVVKNEHLYCSLLFTCIINSMPSHMKICPEVPLRVNDTKQLKVDLVMQGGDNFCAIELVAHVEPSVVKEHITQCKPCICNSRYNIT